MPDQQSHLLRWLKRNGLIGAIIAVSLSLAGIQLWVIAKYALPWFVVALMSGCSVIVLVVAAYQLARLPDRLRVFDDFRFHWATRHIDRQMKASTKRAGRSAS